MTEEKIVPSAAIGSSAENAYKGPETDRRGFISWLSFGWLAYLGVTGGFFTMIVRFLFPNVLFCFISIFYTVNIFIRSTIRSKNIFREKI